MAGEVRQVNLSVISVQAELERIGWAWEPAGDEWIKCRCPAHDDEHPSCGVNVVERYFKCNVPACGAGGDFVTFLALALRQPRGVIFADLQTRYPLEVNKLIDTGAVERWHTDIWTSGPMLAELRKRGVTDDDIRKYRLGFDGKRVTIPIPNEHRQYVNVRKYLPGAPGPEKMKNSRGHGEVRLFPVEQLQYDTIVVVGGEMKAIVTARMLNPAGIGAICATAGEGNWEAEFSRQMRGKRLYISFDLDAEGMDSADKVAARTSSEARWVGVVDLAWALDRDRYPHGDQNDFFGAEGKSAEDFLELLGRVERWVPKGPAEEPEPTDVPAVSLSESTKPCNVGKRVRIKAVVQAKDDKPYLVPREVACDCTRNQPNCHNCPVFARPENEQVRMLLKPDSPAILAMVGSGKKMQRDALMGGLRIPPCKVVHFRTLEHYSVEDLRLVPQLELSYAGQANVQREAYYVGHGISTNQPYLLTGRVHPHPSDQRAVLVAADAVETEDSLDSFKPTDSELEQLHLFRPTDWTVEHVQAKLDDLYADFASNVTRIFHRQDLHLFVDLSYHSPILLRFDGKEVKGWTEVLIVGDSGQGKSETAGNMMKHYGVGEWTVCRAGTSRAGLLGGLAQLGSRWFITWGVIPTHDRRHVTLEEFKGANTQVIAELTDMRSSGIAEINRIQRHRTHARTRLLALSNPRSARTMAEFPFGVEAVMELVGSPEDVRRFDCALIVTASQVDAAQINLLQQNRPDVPHRHTAELCRRLVLWSWSRRADQVHFTEESTKAIMAGAIAMCDRFTDSVPLVDRGGMRHKIARLAAALACRTFSCANADLHAVVVRPCHVEYVIALLTRVYSSPEFGYADYTRSSKATEKLLDEDILRKKVMSVPFVRDFIESMLATSDIEMRDLQDWCGWEFDMARELLSLLVRKRALVRDKNSYHKTAPFIDLLKAMQASDEVRDNDRPDFLRDVDSREL